MMKLSNNKQKELTMVFHSYEWLGGYSVNFTSKGAAGCCAS